MVKVLKKIIYAEAQLDEIACVPHGLYKMGLSGMNISGGHSKRWDWKRAQWLWRVIVCYGNIFGLYSEGDGKPYVGFESVTNKINPVFFFFFKLCLQPGTWIKKQKNYLGVCCNNLVKRWWSWGWEDNDTFETEF